MSTYSYSPIAVVLPASLWPASAQSQGKEALQRLAQQLSVSAYPLLSRCMARGHWSAFERCEGDPAEAWLAEYLHHPAGQNPPWAMLGRSGSDVSEGAVDPEPFTRFYVTPVHLQLAREGVYLLPSEELSITSEELKALWDAVLPLCEEAGWAISGQDGHHAIAVTTAGLSLNAPSPWSSSQLSLGDYLPQGEDLRPWRRLWMDIQVTLHNHPVNAQRQATGLAPINALWWWGAGPGWDSPFDAVNLSRSAAPSTGALGTPHPVMQRLQTLLAGLSSTSGKSRDEAPASALESARLFVADVHSPLDWTGAATSLAALDREVLTPLLASAARFDLILMGREGWRTCRVDSAVRWKLWRNALPIDCLLEPAPAGPSEAELKAAWEAGQRDQDALRSHGDLPRDFK